jgi:membrane protease YdiL (CAAX protease family)
VTSEEFGETRGPFLVWLFLTLYLVLLVTVLARFFVVSKLVVLRLVVQMVEVYGVFLIFLVIFLAVWEKRRSFRDIFSSVGLKRNGIARSLLWSFVLFPLLSAIGFVSMILVSLASPASSSSSNASQIPTWYLWYMIVESFFPVAVVEEAVGRGYILDRLMPQHPSSIVKAFPAILLSSLLFTLYHVPSYLAGYGFSIPMVILLTTDVFPLSVVLSVAYVRAGTRNVVGPVIVHFLLDALPAILMLVSKRM